MTATYNNRRKPPQLYSHNDQTTTAEQAVLADQRGLADTISSARDALAQATGDEERRALRSELAQAVGELAAPLPISPVPAPTPLPAPGDDAEMREIFLEEAHEVLDGAAIGRRIDAAAALRVIAPRGARRPPR